MLEYCTGANAPSKSWKFPSLSDWDSVGLPDPERKPAKRPNNSEVTPRFQRRKTETDKKLGLTGAIDHWSIYNNQSGDRLQPILGTTFVISVPKSKVLRTVDAWNLHAPYTGLRKYGHNPFLPINFKILFRRAGVHLQQLSMFNNIFLFINF